MEGTIITRSSLTVIKLPYNAARRVVEATIKPNQRNTIILTVVVDYAWNAPPFHNPLNICDINVFHELSELIRTHLSAFGPMVTIVLGRYWQGGTMEGWSNRCLSYSHIWRRKGKRKHEWKKKGTKKKEKMMTKTI